MRPNRAKKPVARNRKRGDAIKGRAWELRAYRLQPNDPPIVPAPATRPWMKGPFGKYATRCLPMLIANQAGWLILNTHSVKLTWLGGDESASLTVEYLDGAPPEPPVVSYFGGGIVTWRIPILFRTPQNFNLWVRGPSNYPKQGVYALEGIVETDWSVATFTMNWQMLSPGSPVFFERGEPICMIVPQRKTDLEQFSPVSMSILANPALAEQHRAWATNRAEFIVEREPSDWQKDYMRGRAGERVTSGTHQTRLNLGPFREEV